MYLNLTRLCFNAPYAFRIEKVMIKHVTTYHHLPAYFFEHVTSNTHTHIHKYIYIYIYIIYNIYIYIYIKLGGLNHSTNSGFGLIHHNFVKTVPDSYLSSLDVHECCFYLDYKNSKTTI